MLFTYKIAIMYCISVETYFYHELHEAKEVRIKEKTSVHYISKQLLLISLKAAVESLMINVVLCD